MNRSIHVIKKFFKSSSGDKVTSLRFIGLFLYVGLIVRFIPLRHYYDKFFSIHDSSAFEMQPYSKEICIMHKIMKVLPWKVTCLMESMVIKLYFRLKRMDVPIYIGVETKPILKAHSWYITSERNKFSEFNKS